MKRFLAALLLLSCSGGAAPLLALDLNGNGMSDVWEKVYSVPVSAAGEDYDLDGWNNAQESLLGTDPRSFESGIYVELLPQPSELWLRLETEMGKRYQVETSGDRVSWSPLGPVVAGTGELIDFVATLPSTDGEPLFFRYRYAGDVDADGDELTAWEESQLGSRDDSFDSDGDGMPDHYEFVNGLNPGAHDGTLDADGDGISNVAEHQAGTDPRRFDFVTGTTVGTTAGKLSVGNNGGASYSIPIAVSPGTAGVQPKLSFEYSSRGGNGIMGVGWSVSGLSAITRVPQTLAQDGAIRGVDFSAEDRFAMDGQRLIALSATEFRTEIDSFTRVTALGIGATGPQSFKAETKSGLTYTFGDTAVSPNSRFLAQNKADGTALSWALSKIADRSGNYILFHYTQDQNGGEYLVTSIEYTKNDAKISDAYASVSFEYEGRPDPAIGYVAGSKTSLLKRLKSLSTSFGAQAVRRYTLAYEPSPSTSKSRLTGIQESAGGLSFNTTTFSYSDDGDELVRSDYRGERAYNGSTHDRYLEGDFTGDGRSDFARVTHSEATPRIDVIAAQVTAPGVATQFAETNWSAGQSGYNESDHWLSGDFDGDGRVDVLRFFDGGGTQHRSAMQLYRNQGGSFARGDCSVGGALGYRDFAIVYPADMNGDGRLDLVAISARDTVDPYQTESRTQFAVFLNTTAGGQATFAGAIWGLAGGGDDHIFQPAARKWLIGDLTGDGLPDLLFLRSMGANALKVHAYVNRQGLFAREDSWMDTTGIDETKTVWETGDFNGDGLVDLLHLKKEPFDTALTASPVTVHLATGTSFLPQSWGTVPVVTRQSGAEVRVGDFNGDGRSDLGVIVATSTIEEEPCDGCDPNSVAPAAITPDSPTYNNGYSQRRFLSNGTNGFRDTGESAYYEQQSQQRLNTKRWMPADFNGDGMEDLARLYTFGSGGQQRIACDIWTSTTGAHDLLRTVTDGMNSANSVEYKTLAETSVYSKSEPGDVLPDAIDLMTPMPVVSRVNYDDGLGGQYAIDYQYHGLKADRLRGMLGFRWVKSTDTRTGIWSMTTLRQDFPFTGMAARSETHQPNGGLLSLSTTDYLDKNPPALKVRLPYSERNVAESYELNGALTSRTTTLTYGIDDFGNTTNISVESHDGYSKTTVSTYDNDETTWKLGQLRDSTVTSSAPGQDPVVRKSGFDYNATGQVQAEEIEPGSALAATTSYEFDAFGNNRIATTSGPDIETRATTTLYDERGRFVRYTTNALDQTETRQYDERWGKVTSVTGPNGLTTTTLYDDLGRERLTTRPDGSRTITTYHRLPSPNCLECVRDDPNAPSNAKYFVRSVADGAAPAVIFFDRLGREVRKKTLSGVVAADGTSKAILVDTVYNARGQVEKVSRPYFAGDPINFATTAYDLLGRAERIETPNEGGDVAVTTNVYRGLEVDSINPAQQGTLLRTTTRKDSQGHLVLVTDAKGGTIEYKYDPAGNLIETRQGGNVTKMKYDVRGRKIEMDDPDLGFWSYGYNSLGELISQTDAKGQTVTMQYDKLGRLITRSEFEGTSTWQYDTAPGRSKGKLHIASFTPADGTLAPYQRTLTYDSLGRPVNQTEQIEARNYTVSTGYDALSRVSAITYPSGVWVKQLYDANGYLNEVQRADGSSYWKAKTYDADGHLTQQQLGNGIVTDRVYVPETGVLKRIQSGLNGAGFGVQDLEYEFSVIGNLTKRTDKNQTINNVNLSESFEYDELNRVSKATVAGQTAKDFGYDLAGNITSKAGVGGYFYTPAQPETLGPNERSKPHAVRRVDGGPDALYDANGNMTSGFDRTLTWTSFNMPKLIQRTSTGSSSRFTYDVDHGRITQVAAKNGLMTQTVYVGGLYEEVNDGAKIERKCYISSPAGRIAIDTSVTQVQQVAPEDPPVGTTTFNTKYLHTDHLGSVDVITNEAGGWIERDSFDAWGFRRETSWSGNNGSLRSIITRGYTGHEQLDDLGLVHMNGRVYDPGLGRFLSADPFIQAPTETQNFNRYSYVLNNPLSLTDPSGFNFLNNFGKWLNQNLGSTGSQIVIGVVTVAAVLTQQYYIAAGLTAAGLGATSAAVVAAAGAGFSAGFISSSLSGASLGQAFQSGLLTGGVAALTAGIVGPALHDISTKTVLGFVGKALGHGVVGGALSGAANALQEGSFRDGFLGAFVSQGLSGLVGLVPGTDFGAVATRVVISAVIGGTAAELGGGKFANGAISAAFLRLYNDEHIQLEEGVSLEGRRLPVGPDIKDAQARVRLTVDGVYTEYSVYGYGGIQADPATPFDVVGLGYGLIRNIGRGIGAFFRGRSYTHGYQYASRIRARGVEDGAGHNFPYSFDDVILRTKATMQADGSLLYRAPGTINRTDGVFELTLNPRTNTIFHRQFRGN